MEKGEEAPLTALREVSEECGIPEPDIIRWIQATYHTYILNGQNVLKRTDWFEMKSTYTGFLIPQIEESIDKVTWLDWPEKKEFILENTYGTIKEVLKGISKTSL
jgi:8-oxo-dGTP pyrophosphatase MutT (NUDIX family)